MHLHFGEHPHQREFDGLGYLVEFLLLENRFHDLLQAQGYISVFAGVHRYLFGGQFIHALLLAPRPDQLLDRNRLVMEKFSRQVVHFQLLVGIDKVSRNHGVERLSPDIDPGPPEYHIVEFVIVGHFAGGIAAEQRLQDLNGFLPGQPLLDINGHVVRHAGHCTQRYPDQLVVHRVGTRSFGIKTERIVPGQLLRQRLQVFGHGYKIIAGGVFRVVLQVRLPVSAGIDRHEEVALVFMLVRLFTIHPPFDLLPEIFFGERPEFHPLEEGTQLFLFRALPLQLFPLHDVGYIDLDGNHLLGMQGLIGLLVEGVAVPFRIEIGSRLNRFLERTVILDNFWRPLLPDSTYAGNVVRSVADECQHVDHLFGINAEVLLHLLATDGQKAAVFVVGLVHFDVVVHQLHEVLIRCHQKHLHILGIGPVGNRTDDVVGLVAVLFNIFNTVGLDHLLDQRYSYLQLLRLRRPVGLILLIQVVAKSRRVGIPYHRDVRGFVVGQHLLEGIGETQYRSGRDALCITQVTVDKGKMRAVGQRHTIQQEQEAF